MPDFAGGIKFPVPADKYNTTYGEPQWWRDLAITTRAEIIAQVQAGSFSRPSMLPGDDLHAITAPGQYPFWSGTLNSPGGGGVVYVSELKTTQGETAQLQALAITTGSSPAIHTAFTGSLGWSGWTRVDAGAIDVGALGGGGGGSPSALKTVPIALTVGGSGTSGATSGNFRMPVRYSATVTRWRLHFRNINPRFGTDGPSASISSVYFGPATAGGQFTSAPALVASGMSTGGGEAVTPWQSTPISAGTQYAVAYSVSASATNQVVGGGWSASSANSTSATLTRVVSLPLDVWIEAETAADTPVVAAFGDSLSSGVGATLPVYDSWLSQWARGQGVLPVHYTASGDTMAGWSDPAAYKWTRWQGLSRPDAVIHAMGSNDVFGDATLAQMQERRATTIGHLRSLVSPVIMSATIMPRTVAAPGAQETVRRSYNTWLKGTPDAARDAFDFVPAMSTDDETIMPAFDADGIHLNTAGYAAVAGTITRPLTVSSVASAIAAYQSVRGA